VQALVNLKTADHLDFSMRWPSM